MKTLLHELGVRQEGYVLFCDSQSVIHLRKNVMFHSRSKHIELRYHWIYVMCLRVRNWYWKKIHTSENGSDMFIKPIPPLKLKTCSENAGLVGGHTP
jgi:hypothetical protein